MMRDVDDHVDVAWNQLVCFSNFVSSGSFQNLSQQLWKRFTIKVIIIILS